MPPHQDSGGCGKPFFIVVATKMTFSVVLEATMMELVASRNIPGGKLPAHNFLTQGQRTDCYRGKGPINRRAVRNWDIIVALQGAIESLCKESVIEGSTVNGI